MLKRRRWSPDVLSSRRRRLNVVMPYTHAFHASTLTKPVEQLTLDHPTPHRDFRGRVSSISVRIVVSRDYEENRAPNLWAVGRAVRDMGVGA